AVRREPGPAWRRTGLVGVGEDGEGQVAGDGERGHGRQADSTPCLTETGLCRTCQLVLLAAAPADACSVRTRPVLIGPRARGQVAQAPSGRPSQHPPPVMAAETFVRILL